MTKAEQVKVGNEAEDLFKKVMEELGKNVIKSTAEQDIFEHIDFFVNGASFDVKARKTMSGTNKEIFWVEMINVQGKKGWVQGNADKIAFLTEKSFLIVDRAKLHDFIVEFVDDPKIYQESGYARWYSRKGKKDKVAYVFRKDIEHLLELELPL